MSSIPSDPNTPLMRPQTAAALTEAGYPITANALGGLAHRGTGPKYAMFGKHALYRWRDALAWAEAKLSEPRSSPRAVADDPRLIAAESYELNRAARAEKRDATAELHPTTA
jgi:hypothetical protein